MKFSGERQALLAPLQAVIGVVERRQAMPILGNVLVSGRDGHVALTATDLEVELVAKAEVTVQQPGEMTLPARKLLDILRALPDAATVSITVEGERAVVKSGKSRFVLATLPAADFPLVEDIRPQHAAAIA